MSTSLGQSPVRSWIAWIAVAASTVCGDDLEHALVGLDRALVVAELVLLDLRAAEQQGDLEIVLLRFGRDLIVERRRPRATCRGRGRGDRAGACVVSLRGSSRIAREYVANAASALSPPISCSSEIWWSSSILRAGSKACFAMISYTPICLVHSPRAL